MELAWAYSKNGRATKGPSSTELRQADAGIDLYDLLTETLMQPLVSRKTGYTVVEKE